MQQSEELSLNLPEIPPLEVFGCPYSVSSAFLTFNFDSRLQFLPDIYYSVFFSGLKTDKRKKPYFMLSLDPGISLVTIIACPAEISNMLLLFSLKTKIPDAGVGPASEKCNVRETAAGENSAAVSFPQSIRQASRSTRCRQTGSISMSCRFRH